MAPHSFPFEPHAAEAQPSPESHDPHEPASAPPPHFRLLTQAVAETLATRRDPHQLQSLMTRDAFDYLRDNVGVYGLHQTPRLRRLRAHSPRAGVVEVSAVVQCGARVRALALRFEGVGRHWMCCYLYTA